MGICKKLACVFLLISQLNSVPAFGRLGHFVIGETVSSLVAGDTIKWVETKGYFSEFKESWGLSSIEADNLKSRPGLRWSRRLHFFNSHDEPPAYCPGVQGWNATRGGNILKGIDRFTSLLLTGKGEAFSALMLLHLLQDFSLPTHLSGHRGGNDVFVTYRGKRVNLHRLYDSILVQELADLVGGTDALIAEIVEGARLRFCAASPSATETNEWDFMPGVVARADIVEKMNCKIVWRDDLRKPDVLLPFMKGLLIEAAAFSACHWDRLAAEVLKREKKEMRKELTQKQDPAQLPLHAD
jgi:S1/P1 nuclease